jgi:hypothetical protein
MPPTSPNPSASGPRGTAAGRFRSRHRASAPAGALLLASSGLIESDDVGKLLAWENRGFSVDASVQVGAHDRVGLERLLRSCARLLHVRLVEHCCQWQPKGRCLFMADS